jgi:hypothetical protein
LGLLRPGFTMMMTMAMMTMPIMTITRMIKNAIDGNMARWQFASARLSGASRRRLAQLGDAMDESGATGRINHSHKEAILRQRDPSSEVKRPPMAATIRASGLERLVGWKTPREPGRTASMIWYRGRPQVEKGGKGGTHTHTHTHTHNTTWLLCTHLLCTCSVVRTWILHTPYILYMGCVDGCMCVLRTEHVQSMHAHPSWSTTR